MKKRVNIALDETLLEHIDQQRGLVPRSRLIQRFLEKKLTSQEMAELLKSH